MKIVLFFLNLLVFVSLTQGQSNTYPEYSPFLNDLTYDEDNPYPYYYKSETCPSGSCYQGEFQYAFGEGRNQNDGNSTMNVYFANSDMSNYPDGKPLVVILHGREGTKENIRQKGIGEAFAKRGFFAIEPDYTTEADSCLTGNLCKTKEEWKWVLRYAVSDVRAAIRKILKESDERAIVPDIDQNSIFIVGFSFGAITAAHLAYADPSDFVTAEYDVSSLTCGLPTYDPEFYDSIDYLSICEDYSVPCPNDFGISASFDLQDGIKGVSLVSPMLLDVNYIDNQDRAQALMFHGTCDELVPIDRPRVDEFWFRKKYRTGQLPLPDDFPCNDMAAGTRSFGSIPIYERMLQLPSTPEFEFLPGFFLICGGAHGLSGDYFNFDQTGDINGIGTYETVRFFSTLMNDDHHKRFLFNMDHKSLPNQTQANLDSLAPKCAAMPLGGFGEDELKGGIPIYQFMRNNYCPDCGDGDQTFNSIIFKPEYQTNQTHDSLRYALIDPTEVCEEEGPDAFISAGLYSLYGDLILNLPLNTKSGLPNLLGIPDLDSGMYVLRYPDGRRRTVVIY